LQLQFSLTKNNTKTEELLLALHVEFSIDAKIPIQKELLLLHGCTSSSHMVGGWVGVIPLDHW
jgi:hypothetical protein